MAESETENTSIRVRSLNGDNTLLTAILSLMDWISDARSQRYTDLQIGKLPGCMGYSVRCDT